jgi:hypothetical protein
MGMTREVYGRDMGKRSRKLEVEKAGSKKISGSNNKIHTDAYYVLTPAFVFVFYLHLHATYFPTVVSPELPALLCLHLLLCAACYFIVSDQIHYLKN